MFRFAKDTVCSSLSNMLERYGYSTVESIENAGFKIINNQVIVPKNTPFEFLSDKTGNVELEVYGEEFLFCNGVEAIID